MRYDTVQAPSVLFPLAAEWAVEAFWKASYFPEPQPCEIDMSDER